MSQNIVYNGDKIPFLQNILVLYENYSTKIIGTNKYNINLNYLISTLNYDYQSEDQYNKQPKDYESVVVLFSGGKDSVAVAQYCKQKYKKVYLYHIKGLNRSYPYEYENAQKIAEYLQLPLIIEQVKYNGKSDYRINPLKNQVAGALALNYCIQNNLAPVIAVGDIQSDHIDEAVYDLDYSDTYEMWHSFSADAKKEYANFYLEMPLQYNTHSLEIVTTDLNLFKLCGGCMTPPRFKNQLIQTNEAKYNIKLYPYRCGSCYKCAIEYIFLANHKLVPFNKEFYKHCLDIFKRKYADTYPHNEKTKDIKIIYKAFMQEDYNDYLNKLS